MKKCPKTLSLILGFLFVSFTIFAQTGDSDSTGLPGDNFDLQGALQMFEKAGSPEEFEKLINSENNSVNNLDLNGDGETDYVKVIDRTEKGVHAFVLQVPVSETESQDIAVIELEKTGNKEAMIQIVGDEEIYGNQVIVEPKGDDDNAFVNNWNNQYASGPSVSFDAPTGIIVNVWFWPSVQFVFAPAYRPWISPWRWRYYPVWWRPWRPFAWHVWHPRRIVYHRVFVVAPALRVVRAQRIYTPYRTTSVIVRNRNTRVIGNKKITKTSTTVIGPRGNSATKTTTTVSGRRGKGKVTKTRVRRH